MAARRDMRLSASRVCIAGALALWAHPSSAQQDPYTEARSHFEQGLAMIRQERWRDAIPELIVARDLAPTPAVLFNLGYAQRAVGQVGGAITSFRAFLERGGEQIPAERRREVDGYLAELTQRLAHVAVAVEPAVARVAIDGVTLDPGASEAPIDPGEHVLLVTAQGHQGDSRTVSLRPGERLALVVHLAPVVPVASVAPAPTAPSQRAYRLALQLGGLFRVIPDGSGFSSRASLRVATVHEPTLEVGRLRSVCIDYTLVALGYFFVGNPDSVVRLYAGAAVAGVFPDRPGPCVYQGEQWVAQTSWALLGTVGLRAELRPWVGLFVEATVGYASNIAYNSIVSANGGVQWTLPL